MRWNPTLNWLSDVSERTILLPFNLVLLDHLFSNLILYSVLYGAFMQLLEKLGKAREVFQRGDGGEIFRAFPVDKRAISTQIIKSGA